MTARDRAKKITDLLNKAVLIQAEAKRVNGHDCFNMKSVTILKKLQAQIDAAFTELSNQLS